MKTKKHDLLGKRFIMLDVLYKCKNGKWKCRCDCGKETEVDAHSLVSSKTKSCGCLRGKKAKQLSLKLLGERFGKLTVKRLVGLDNHTNNRRECLCDCGNIHITTATCLKRGISKMCKKCSYKTISMKSQSGLNTLYGHYKIDAEKRNLNFELDIDFFKDITSMNCAYCNRSPENICKTYAKHSNHGDYQYNGIDRVDNNLGYNIKNCVPCCKKCNEWKRASKKEEFLGHILKIYNNIWQKNPCTE